MSNCSLSVMRGLLLVALSGILVVMVSSNFPAVIIKACVKETKVKNLDLALLYGNEHVPATQPAKCYLTCLFDSIGFTVNNKVNADILTGSGDTHIPIPFMKVIEACKDLQGTDECDIGYMVYSCMRDYSKGILSNKRPEESKTMAAVE